MNKYQQHSGLKAQARALLEKSLTIIEARFEKGRGRIDLPTMTQEEYHALQTLIRTYKAAQEEIEALGIGEIVAETRIEFRAVDNATLRNFLSLSRQREITLAHASPGAPG